MAHKNKSPLAHAGANRASKENTQYDFTKASHDKPPPRHIKAYVKSVLVTLGANGILPRRLCTKLINFLGLRGE